jgi:glucose/mannose transport system substrate-binding protein
MAGPSVAAEKAEVIHWWTSGGESAAVKVFADQFNAAGGEWVDAAIAGGEAARAAGINRIVGGNPPTAMQFNTGKQFEDLVAQGLLGNLDEVAKADGWDKFLSPVLVKAVTRDGHYFAVPVNIHSNNWLWYNTALLEANKIEPPKTWDELFAAMDKLKAAGVIPMAQSGDAWTQLLLFNDVLLGVGGRDLYLKVYSDNNVEAVKSPEFAKVVETFGKLREYGDAGQQGRQWNQATGLVVSGKAGFNFMGDWAKGEVIAAGLTPGKEIGCVPGIGNQVYWVGGDVFVFPKTDDAAALKAQALLAHTMLTPETQVAFNAKKGSVPVRGDVDTSKLDACAQAGLKLLGTENASVPGFDFLQTPDAIGSIQDVIGQFWTTPSQAPADLQAKFAEIIAAE